MPHRRRGRRDALCHPEKSNVFARARARGLRDVEPASGNLRNPPELTLNHYSRQCSIDSSGEQLAQAGPPVMRHVCAHCSRLLAIPGRTIALTTTCGTYDAARECAYRIGSACKSGVGGGISAVVPDRCGVARGLAGRGGQFGSGAVAWRTLHA
ncbi:glutaminase [Nocardia sp. NPDC004604]|uniref:glutaminase n=1 Tax=Nocardia sp. NPDC004604 TaxID=3157013 RepID=UPI0033B9EB50